MLNPGGWPGSDNRACNYHSITGLTAVSHVGLCDSVFPTGFPIEENFLPRFMIGMLWLCAAWCAPVWADVYGFIDEQGVAHLAPKALDERYRLFKRGSLPTVQTGPAVDVSHYLAGRDTRAMSTLGPLIDSTARRHQLEPALLHALITVESGYHASATSPKGAQGLMQLMPDTAARFGVSGEAVSEPRRNLEAGARYLSFLLGLFNHQLDLALAAYNAGEGVVQRLGKIPPYEETEQYVKAVRALYLRQGGRVLADGRLRSKVLATQLAMPTLPAWQPEVD